MSPRTSAKSLCMKVCDGRIQYITWFRQSLAAEDSHTADQHNFTRWGPTVSVIFVPMLQIILVQLKTWHTEGGEATDFTFLNRLKKWPQRTWKLLLWVDLSHSECSMMFGKMNWSQVSLDLHDTHIENKFWNITSFHSSAYRKFGINLNPSLTSPI